MVFKVDYEKMSEVGHSFLDKSEELNSLYLDVIEICKEIDENWKSEDSTIYLRHMAAFLVTKIKENERLFETGKVLNKVSSRYGDQNDKWANDLLKSDLMKKEKEVK
jgi:hypothetical protein